MPEGSASQKKNASQQAVEELSQGKTPFAGEILFLAPDHYDAQAQKVLEGIAVKLGAEITSEREKCTMVIVNILSPKLAAEREHIRHLKTSSSGLPTPVIRSYHWLVLCGRTQSRLDPCQLVNEIPFMVSNLTERYPVKVWVSKNVARNADESPEEAQANTIRDLENAGAIIVEKRAYADVLIVDVQSKFYATVKKEREARGRTWQKLAQRDWVEYCMQERTVTLRTAGEDEDEIKSSDEDSFVEEPPVPARSGTGPGRPTGKPRIDYSSQDDDFLCRWLAAFYPEGSWTSRKTFALLALDHERYPLADRHSSQSWQERFKKNSAAFKRRIRRFVDEGVDETLKTAQERRKDREKRAQEAGLETERPEPLVAAVSATGSPRQQSPETLHVAGTAPRVSAPEESTAAPQSDVPAETSAKGASRTLVEEDPEEPIHAPPSTVPAETSAKGASRRLVEEDPEEPIRAPPADVPVETSSKGSGRRLVQQEPESDPRAVTIVKETETIQVLVPETVPTGLETPSIDPEREADVRSQENPTPGTLPEPPAETIQVEASMSDEVASERVVRDEFRTVIEQTPARTSASVSGPLEQLVYQLGGSSTRETKPTTVDPNLIQVRPASELLGQPSRRDGAYSTPSPKRSTKKRRRSEIPADIPAGSTPLRQEILRSQEKRQRTMERHARSSSSNRRSPSPDKVYAVVGIPPRRPRPSSVTTPAPMPGPARTPSPELTPEERHERFLRGSEIVNNVAALYRAKMSALSRKHRIGQKEIAAATKEVRESGRAPGATGLDWDRLESVLEEKYGK